MQTDLSTIPTEWWFVIIALGIWELVWKGLALWRAAKRDEKSWYVVLLIINTVGILPIIYLILTSSTVDKEYKAV